jgi:filamentous hemagglutinin family protein
MSPRSTRAALASSVALIALMASSARAGPNGGTVVGGSATISGTGTVVVNQSSSKAIINWQTFNLATGESATFNQPGADAIVLNRVIGGMGPSFIDGTLRANGRVFIVNGDGILFGRNASINTAGFLATTNDIRNDDFMAGRMNFTMPGRPDASIVNYGTITAASGGFAALVAPGVRNSGTITATLGTVSLAAGNAFTLDFYGDKLITLAVNDQIAGKVIDVATGKPLTSLVSNEGKLSANGGRVELTAAAARAVVDSVINNKGVIEANSIGTRSGMIVLGAATGRSKPVGAPTQTVELGGTISAAGTSKGTTGGTVVVTGENIQLAGASIDASGDLGGGKVLIGGAGQAENAFTIPAASMLSVDGKSVVNVSATGSGNGGTAVLGSDQQTTFAGSILAMGGPTGGSGGFVETSSNGVLAVSGTVDLSAPRGKAGTWLLDPPNLRIANFCEGSCVTVASIESGLKTGDVVVATGTTGPGTGNISVDNSLTWSSNHPLTLSAYGSINVNEGVTISNAGAGNLILRADNTGTGTGTVNFFGGQVDFSQSTGTVSIYYNPTCACDNKYTSPTDYSGNVLTNGSVTNQLTAYMLVNSAADLTTMGQSAIDGPITGNYALGRNVDATGFGGFQSVGTTFSGLFDGNGGLGTNYTISNLNMTAPFNDGLGNSFGLFPFLTGTVRNLNLANVNITGNDNLYFLGTVAGDNAGTIANVTVLSGSVNGLSFQGISAGGLVGQNEPGSVIKNSSANVTVTVGNASGSDRLNFAGGLVGISMGSISNSSAAGNVTGGTFSRVGGLLGQNGLNCDCEPSGPGTVTASSATGTVSGSGTVQIGAFVGKNELGTISGSSASGNVNGTNLVSTNGQAVGVGGFAGENADTINNSHAGGNVTISTTQFGLVFGGAFVGVNDNGATIQGLNGQFTYATGSVTGGAQSLAGGFAGFNAGSISSTYGSGSVQVGADSYAGGFFAVNVGSIFQSFATGPVTDDPGSVLGGFGALNLGSLSQVFATGTATGGDNSVVAGLVAVNGALAPSRQFGSPGPVGSIKDSYATGPATGGAGSIVAGLTAVNDGMIKTSYSAGPVTGGNGSSTGGLAAQNNSSFQFSDKQIDSLTQVSLKAGAGAITNSYWNTQTSGQQTSAGGTGMTSQQLASGLPPGFDPAVWTILPDPSFPYFPWQNGNIPTVVLPPPSTPSQPIIINNLTGSLTLVSLPPPVDVLPFPPPPVAPPSFGEPRLFAVPPAGETRFVKDEVILEVDCDAAQAALDAVARDMHLTFVASMCLSQTHKKLLRAHIDNGQAVARVILGLRRYGIIALAQANFIYIAVQDQAASDPDLAGRTQEGDAAQYALGKLGVFDAHRLLKGDNVTIAVIDSEIDIHHPDLDGVIAAEYDAVGKAEPPHPHGTGMAGAIAAHRRLMGIAPSARLYAVHAFSSGAATAESTTYSIRTGLDWAAEKGVRVINMSFAGPRDPAIERALKTAHDRGVVLIAAAGNAGPKSAPLFPAADPNVIAVTATDVDDKVFSGANRGSYIAVAAPGVDILVPGTDGGYQLTTGTSVACAEVSGVAALLLERNPKLTPDDVRKILTTSAKKLGASTDYGAGLVDLAKAIQEAGELKPLTPARR